MASGREWRGGGGHAAGAEGGGAAPRYLRRVGGREVRLVSQGEGGGVATLPQEGRGEENRLWPAGGREEAARTRRGESPARGMGGPGGGGWAQAWLLRGGPPDAALQVWLHQQGPPCAALRV